MSDERIPIDQLNPPDTDLGADIPDDVLDRLEAERQAANNGARRNGQGKVNGATPSRPPPHNIAAEESLLGACLMSAQAIADAAPLIGPNDFYKPAHVTIWTAILTLAADDIAVDVITVGDHIGPQIDNIGGPQALVSLLANTPATTNAAHYARIVADHATLRRLTRAGYEIAELGYALPDDAGAAVTAARDHIDRLDPGTQGLADHLVTGRAVLDLPPPEPLVDGIVNLDSFAVLFGRPGSGKSVLALDIALCIAAGSWWHRHEIRQGNVLYVAAEGQTGLGIRAEAWATLNRVEIPDAITWLTRPANLLDAGATHQLAAIAKRLKPVLVVIDTLNRSMAGGNENGPEDMGTAIAACDQIRHATGACILLVHHSGKEADKGARGHSSLLGAVDTELELKNAGDNILTLHTSKQKEMPDGGMPLRFTLAEAAESVALAPYTGRLEDGTELSVKGQAVLQALFSIQVSGGISAGAWQRAALHDGVSERAFYDSRKRLLDLDLVTNIGSKAQPRYIASDPSEIAPGEARSESEF